MKKSSVKRVVMTKRVAQLWVLKHATAEYKVSVYPSFENKINLPSWLRSFREGRAKFGSLTPFDFGVEDKMDVIVIRSRDYEALKSLNATLEDIGFETSGLW